MGSYGWPNWVSFEEDRLFKVLKKHNIDFSGIYYVPTNQPMDANRNNMDLLEIYTRLVEIRPAEAVVFMPPDVFYVIALIVMIKIERRTQRYNNYFSVHNDLSLKLLFKERRKWDLRYPIDFKYFTRIKFKNLLKK